MELHFLPRLRNEVFMVINGMIILAQMSGSADAAENRVVFLVAILIGAVFLWRFIRRNVPVAPDPWNEEVAAAVEKEDALPLCTHCLAQHDHNDDFCPQCGAPVGPYTNSLPFPYLFSIGHMLRVGTQENFKRSPLVVMGFVLIGFIEYFIFAPVYWFMVLRNLSRQPEPTTGISDGEKGN